MDPRLASELVKLVDERFRQLAAAQPRTAYGVVSAVDTVNRRATVLVSGEAIASGGFKYALPFTPVVGELVRVVVDPRGDRYVDELLGSSRDRLALGLNGDVELSRSAANVLRLAAGDRLDNDALGLVMRKTTTQNLANNTTTKVTSYTTTDRAGFGVTWNPGGFSEARIDVAGLWLIVASVAFDTNATGRRVIGVSTATGGADPGTAAPTENFDSRGASPSGNTNSSIALIRQLAVNDTVAVVANQAAGGTLNLVNAVLSLARIGV